MRLISNFSLLVAFAVNTLMLSAQCVDFVQFDYSQSTHTIFFSPAYDLEENQSVVSFFWDLGDGTVSSLEFPVHTYDNPDAYTVCLTLSVLTDGELCAVDFCDEIVILEALPCNVSAGFEWVDGGMGEIVLQEMCETNFFTQIVNYHWESSEGDEAQGELAALEFENLVEPEVCLTVNAISQGNTCSATLCKYVDLEIPTIDLNPDFVIKENDGCDFRFINITQQVGGQDVTYAWLMDGEEIPYAAQPLFQFETNGVHEVCLHTETNWYGALHTIDVCKFVTSNCEEQVVQQDLVTEAFVQAKHPVVVSGNMLTLAHEPNEVETHLAVTIYSLQGQVLMSTNVAANQRIDLSELGSGIFVLQFQSGNQSFSEKIVLP